jgi:hypothetical protein
MVDLTTAASVGTLFGTAISALKEAREMAKDSKDSALKEKIGEAFESLLDLKGRLYEYDEENRKLKAEIARRDEFEGPVPPHDFVFRKGDREHPMCPACFNSGKSSYLLFADGMGLKQRHCNLCKWQTFL